MYASIGSGRLLIAGTRLTVSPEAQTVPFNTPTIVETHLQGYDAEEGSLPSDLRVLADLTGPEIDGVMVLETVPDEPFRIPRLSLKGQYQLDNIRLVEGDELLAYAEPRSAGILVTQVLVTRVTSRPLSLDELRSYGVVVDNENFRAFNFTFGFGVDGQRFDYNLPVVYEPVGGVDAIRVLTDQSQLSPGGSSGTTAQRFAPPQLAPFHLKIESEGSDGGPTGGCMDPEGDCYLDAAIPLPGVILFPTDVTVLHQFFSVVLVAKNDAPEGDPLRIRDLTARVVLPSALRMAETEPPTPLGVPVPIRVPGPDGQLGTGDDLTFLIAQAEGQAEVVVESLRQGTHFVEFQLEGVLEGLPGNEVRRVTGSARGAVVVRDPTLGVTITHPDVVRTDEEYSLLLTISNTSNAPVNLITLTIPPSGVSGAQIVGENSKTIPSLPPGESEVVEFRVRSLRTGRVIASSIRSGSEIDPRFEFTVGVGENGIPLSPTTLILPKTTDALPPLVARRALAMLGLGYSLATLPASAQNDHPKIGIEQFHEKVYWLSQAGRHVSMGEEPFDSLAVFAMEWSGARDKDWEWDKLRRTTQKGGLLGDALAQTFAAEAAETTAVSAFERFAATTAFLGKLQGALATGDGAVLEVVSRSSGKAVQGGGTDPARNRTLPFADLYDLGQAEMVFLGVPEENGYQAVLRDANGGSPALHILVPDAAGGLRIVTWGPVVLSADGVATVDFRSSYDTFILKIDADGDGVFEAERPATERTIAPRPFTALAAVQNNIDPSGHIVELLLTQDIDLASLLPVDPNRFTIPGKVSNGGLVPVERDVASFFETLAENPFEGLRDTRIVRVIFDNPISPYVENRISVRDLRSVSGQQVVNVTLPVQTTVTDEGTIVRGTVYGPDGQPVPFAKVELHEVDFYYFALDNPCRKHLTAAVQTDASGRFMFDYVRKTQCTDVFSLVGHDLANGKHGSARGRVRFVGQEVHLDIVMLGRGSIRGQVRYEDGSVPETLEVVAYSPVFFEGRKARVSADGSYEVGDVPVGTITLGATDREGSFVYQTVEIPTAGAVVQRDLTIIRRAPTQATGDIRGVVYETDGVTPVYNAYLALYLDGELAGVQRSDPEGRFDFGTVPVGRAEIEGFDAETGLTGVQVFFDVLADQVNNVTLRLRDDRGTVEGHVYLQSVTGTRPLAGAVVWVSGTPFNTVTDANGYYRLDGVFAGSRQVLAADLARNRQTSAPVSVSANTTVARDLYFVDTISGGLTGEVIGFNGSPVPFALVHLANGYDQWYAETTTDASGRFVFPNLGVGTYEVHAIKGSDGGKAFATIRFQGETPFMRIQFKQGSIRGVVKARNESGNLVGVRSLVIYRPTAVRGGLVDLDWEPHTLETNGDGTFVIPDVLIGRYVLTVTNAFHGEKTVRDELVFHGEVGEHEFVFERNGTIRGVVYDWDGTTPVANAKVDLRHPNFSAYDLRTDAEGRFKFELVPPGGRFPIDAEIDAGAIFRKARVWVNFTRFGQEMDVEIKLQRQGSVIGFVEDSNGVAVAGAVVTLKEHAFPHRTIVQNADRDGYFSFTNIFAGPVSIDAKAPSLGGLGARTSVEIVSEGEEATALLVLEATGEITGKVLSPVDGQPVSAAQVDLLTQHGGLFDSVTTDAQGVFRFRLLPLNLYGLRAFDPRTGRHGSRDGVRVEFNNHVMEADVTLEVRGEVDGHLYEPNSAVGIPGATVKMETRSLVHFTTYSSTDVNGYFEFLGVPQGPFKLSSKEPEGRRNASGTGEITAEGERVTVDLYLEASGKVKGSVFNPQGIPDGLFPNANTLIYQDGQVVGATLANPFEFPGIIAAREFELHTFEVGGEHKATAKGTLSTEGEEVTVDLRMVPIGDTTIVVQDSFGAPVSGAEVTVKNNGFYREKTFVGTTDAAGRAVFRDLGKGTVSAYAKHPVTQLRGSGNGVIELEDQMLEVAVRLEDSGQIRGRAVKSDGVTPAADALVVVTRASRTLQTLADANGDFSFASVPLGAFKVFVQERLGPGNIERNGTVAANGQVVDVGTLVLDDSPPYVVSLEPLAGTRDLPLSTIVTIRFNERLDRSRFSGSWLVFRTLSGRWVNHNLAWADNDSTLVLTPTSPLESFTGYEVIVNDAYDPAGRRLSDRVKTVFHTVDVVPPAVVDVLPRNGQKQVAVDAQVKVTFSEPVAFASLSGTAFQLTDLTTGQGVTTTFLHLFGEREVLLTPADALASDHEYRLTVQNVRDKGGNAMPQPVSISFFTVDTTPPQITAVGFPDGTSFTSGDDVPVTVEATDLWGVKRVAVRVTRWTFADEAAPFAVTALAPVVAQERDVTLTIEATDIHGNTATTERTIRVAPHANAEAPEIAVDCARDGSPVLPNVQAEFQLRASDDEVIESLAFSVDGVELKRVEPVNQPETVGTFVWMPPANAAPGTRFAIRLEARDFAGNVTAEEFEVAVPTGTVLNGGRSLNSTHDGQALTLVNGTFILRAPLTLPSLTIMRGAKLVAPQQGDVRLDVQGAFTIQCGATLDASGAGYLGGLAFSTDGGAPQGVSPAKPDAGGSHGGTGVTWNGAGPAGEVYDSVYAPQFAGGGGAHDGDNCCNGSAGGGLVDVKAGHMVVDGSILSNGVSAPEGNRPGGAGGTVRVRAATVSGGGTIAASGGDGGDACSTSNEQSGAGGGGRVALEADVFDRFDPASQVQAKGGSRLHCSTPVGYAAPGTIFSRQAGTGYGSLLVDNGELAGGADRVGPSTRLPALGQGQIAAFQAAGADAWLSRTGGFRPEWLGAWVALLDANGGELGVFRVAEIGADGRARLAGAGAVAGAESYRGEYRFDRIELRHGAQLAATDPLDSPDWVLNGDVGLPEQIVGHNLVIRSGTVLRPASGNWLRFSLTGKLTIEPGAVVDVSGLGFAGGKADHLAGYAPDGVAAAQPDAGGSHGGTGIFWNGAGPAGAVFGSVYAPRLAGGGGAHDGDSCCDGSAGGGIVEIQAAEVVLHGEIRADGIGATAGNRPGGAGGAVWIRTGTLSGAGSVSASGGHGGNGCSTSNEQSGAGGGGRVAVEAGQISGFDPAAQIKALGGGRYHCSNPQAFAAPGTVYLKTAGDTYGLLRIDSGEEASGADRVGPSTELPELGGGALTGFQAAGADAWASREGGFPPQWQGAWMVVLDAAGAELGAFQVKELDAQGRARLAGAGTVVGAASHRGEYRFDQVDLRRGAGLLAHDLVAGGEVVFDGEARISDEVKARNVRIKSGSVVRPASGSTLRFVVTETLTIEANATLDVSGKGYAGGTAQSTAGKAPAGVTGSQPDAGGSHGGVGVVWNGAGPAGGVYDSVYAPQLPGGGGGKDNDSCCDGSAGGGVVEIDA
ncbi:MAG TPA: carboxypeptidase regulatory-like domain-containing protein, partial [Thermoanaerobaculia bacterium]